MAQVLAMLASNFGAMWPGVVLMAIAAFQKFYLQDDAAAATSFAMALAFFKIGNDSSKSATFSREAASASTKAVENTRIIADDTLAIRQDPDKPGKSLSAGEVQMRSRGLRQ